MAKSPHIAFISSAGFTHLFPVIEFSKRLLQLHPDLHITCIIPILETLPSSSESYLQTLPPNIHSILLPTVHKHDMPENVHPGAQVQLTVTLSLPYIRQELKSLISRSSLVALVTDCFAHEALDFAAEFNLLSYMYLPYAAMMFSVYFCNSMKLEDSEFRDVPESVEIPPCIPVRGREIVDSLYDGLVRKQFFERAKKPRLIDGVLFNSFLELETATIGNLQEETKGKKPQIYPVGPIIQSRSNNETNGSNLDCLTWLNNQPPKSVLYVSFGSGGTLSQDQLNELTFGLELSGKKFLWVVRPPSNDVSAAYLSASSENPLDFVPNGFLERTKDQGLVVPSWAPQIPILSHNSVGGFLSHCGWNSTMESIVHGVPIIAWPLFAEQKMNAAFLTDCLKVALWPEPNQRGMVERDEIAKVIIRFMEDEEGRQVRKRMEDLKDSAANALNEDGSSTQTLSQIAMDLRDRT
ncbi:hydroquinone glucosyltransferase-like [Neltuma alba]|uniref:hydroquinone glucosyltransferase-like n=1 Tax=Neltuma alba TaxID=207710 RepID=UPI0010A5387F|nr:hydroquinone glucosyltransferase-like [Prosopis alba]